MELQEYFQGLYLLSEILEGKINNYPLLEQKIQGWKRDKARKLQEIAIFSVFENCHGYTSPVLEYFLKILSIGIPDLKRVELRDENLSRDYSFYFVCLCLLDFQDNSNRRKQKKLGEKLYRTIYSMIRDISEIQSPGISWQQKIKIWEASLKNWFFDKQYMPFIGHTWLSNKEDDFKDKFLTLWKLGFSIDCDEQYDRLTIQINNNEIAPVGRKYCSGLLMMPIQIYLFEIDMPFGEKLEKKDISSVIQVFKNHDILLSPYISIKQTENGIWLISEQFNNKEQYRIEKYSEKQWLVYSTKSIDEFCQNGIVSLKSRLADFSPMDIVFYFNDPKMESINSILSYCLFGLGVYILGYYDSASDNQVALAICEQMERKIQKKQLHCFYQTLGKPFSLQEKLIFLRVIQEYQNLNLHQKMQSIFDALEEKLDKNNVFPNEIGNIPYSTYIRSIRFILPQEKIISNIYHNTRMLFETFFPRKIFIKIAIFSLIVLIMLSGYLSYSYQNIKTKETISFLQNENSALKIEKEKYQSLIEFSHAIDSYLEKNSPYVLPSPQILKTCIPILQERFKNRLLSEKPFPLKNIRLLIKAVSQNLPQGDPENIKNLEFFLQAEENFLAFSKLYQDSMLKNSAVIEVFGKFADFLHKHEKYFDSLLLHPSREFYRKWHDSYNFYQKGKFVLFPIIQDTKIYKLIDMEGLHISFKIIWQKSAKDLWFTSSLQQLINIQANQVDAKHWIDTPLNFVITLSSSDRTEEYTGEKEVLFSAFNANPYYEIELRLKKKIVPRIKMMGGEIESIPMIIYFFPLDQKNKIIPFPYCPKAEYETWYKE